MLPLRSRKSESAEPGDFRALIISSPSLFDQTKPAHVSGGMNPTSGQVFAADCTNNTCSGTDIAVVFSGKTKLILGDKTLTKLPATIDTLLAVAT